jgi:hypothetical protein
MVDIMAISAPINSSSFAADWSRQNLGKTLGYDFQGVTILHGRRAGLRSTHIPRLNKPLHHHRGDNPRQWRREYEAAHNDNWYPEKCMLRQCRRRQDGD